MIVFDLKCACGLEFEGWFGDRADFERQQADGLVRCPGCGGVEVRKILSPVAYNRCAGSTATGSGSGHPEGGSGQPAEAELAAALRMVQEFVRRNFEDVGAKLAETSLRMRYGLEEPRNIRGFASEEEKKMLREEGGELLTIPMPREDEAN